MTPFTDEIWSSYEACKHGTGEEFDWFGLDSSGHLAIFTTAGYGAVPKSLWQYRTAYNELEARISELRPAFSFERVFSDSGDYTDWLDFASKGLFAFDFHDIHRTSKLSQYDLMARPVNPVPANQFLANHNLAWLPRIQVVFTELKAVPIELIS